MKGQLDTKLLKRILVVTRHTPVPWEDGAGAYLYSILRFLEESGYQVDVAWLAPSPGFFVKHILGIPTGLDQKIRFYLCCNTNRFKDLASRIMKRTLAVLKCCNPSWLHSKMESILTRPWMSPPDKQETRFVRRLLCRIKPATLIVNYPWLTPLFDLPEAGEAKRICLSHDVQWKLALINAELEGVGTVPEMGREEEAQWLKRAQCVAAISSSDAKELQDLAPEVPVIVMPKVMEMHGADQSFAGNRLFFVGSNNSRNREGLEWFFQHVWPLVQRRIPDVHLDICGSIHKIVTIRPRGVQFHRTVRDLVPFYRKAAIIVIPVLRATGLSIKLAEAAGYGKPVVCTSAVLAGHDFLRSVLTGFDQPETFADETIRLLLDREAREKLSRKIIDAAKDFSSPSHCYGPLVEAMRN